MNYQELKTIWNQEEVHPQEQINLHKRLVHELAIGKIRSGLFEIRWSAYFELIINGVFIILFLGFFVDHLREIQFALPAALLILILAASQVFNIYKLRIQYQLRTDDPIVETQRKLERINYLERIDLRTLYVLIPLFATPFLIVTTKALFNIDLYVFERELIYFTGTNILVGIIVTIILSRFPDKRLQESLQFIKELNKL